MVRPLLLLLCMPRATLAVSEAGKKVPGQEDGQGLRKEACAKNFCQEASSCPKTNKGGRKCKKTQVLQTDVRPLHAAATGAALAAAALVVWPRLRRSRYHVGVHDPMPRSAPACRAFPFAMQGKVSHSLPPTSSTCVAVTAAAILA